MLTATVALSYFPPGFAVAVANAVDAVKAEADIITEGTRDQGFNEALKMLIPGVE